MPSIKAVLSKRDAGTRAEKVGGIIEQFFGEDFGKGVYAREGHKLDVEDRKCLMIGVLLKMDTASLNKFVNDEREKRNLEKITIDRRDVYDFRKGYAELIDQAYIAVASYIGDVHPYTDKLHRLGLYNDIAEALEDIPKDLALGGDEITVKKANLLIKTLTCIQAEMGNKTLIDFLKPKGRKFQNDDDEGKIEFTKEEAQKILTEKFQNQLPIATTTRFNFTDYTNCANGEQFSGSVVCWNDSMCDGVAGKVCAVQEGKIQRCPKFLNKSLLENKEWLLRMREKVGLSYKDIATMCGADKIDDDIKEKLKYYFAKHGISGNISFTVGNPNFTNSEDNSETTGQTDL